MSELQQLLDVIRTGNFLVLDTETTGLERGEVIQIGVVDSAGATLLDTLVKPVEPIPPSTTRIHGITNQMVATAPRFADVIDTLRETLNSQQVIVYNAVYDRKMLHQSAEAAGIEKTDWKAISRWWCAMEGFAEVYGDWNSMRRIRRLFNNAGDLQADGRSISPYPIWTSPDDGLRSQLRGSCRWMLDWCFLGYRLVDEEPRLTPTVDKNR